MEPQSTFSIEFEYRLTESIMLKLTAKAELHHSQPHYFITDFNFKDHPNANPLLPDIDIMAVKENGEMSWVHTDSFKETILSAAVGKAIEATGDFQIGEPAK